MDNNVVLLKSQLSESQKDEINSIVNDTITRYKYNYSDIEQSVRDGCFKLNQAKARAGELADQGALKAFWRTLTGKNRKLRGDLEQSIIAAQYAMYVLIVKLLEQNIISMEFVEQINYDVADLKNRVEVLEKKAGITHQISPSRNNPPAITQRSLGYNSNVQNSIQRNPLKIGETIHFGRYYWRILKVNNDSTALIITEDIIERRAYHSRLEDVTWESCDLRIYLNNKFYADMFNSQEQKQIIQTYLINKDNPKHSGKGGSPTYDKVFLLSIEEAEELFKYNDFGKASRRYWLRSPAWDNGCAAFVWQNGTIRYNGHWVTDTRGLRPALTMRFY